ncbi:MAG: Thymidylate kinase, partial [Parcubacteria group bacterium GW2011_GWF2_50_9]
MIRGRFIVIDGGEGSGKTTLLRALAKKLPKSKVLVTHEPGGTAFADKIRKLFLSPEAGAAGSEVLFGLIWAARSEHLKHKIIPALRVTRGLLPKSFSRNKAAAETVVAWTLGNQPPLCRDSKAAADIIKVLDAYVGLNVDTAPLLKQAQLFEKKLKGIM